MLLLFQYKSKQWFVQVREASGESKELPAYTTETRTIQIVFGDRAGNGLHDRIPCQESLSVLYWCLRTAVKGELLHHNQQFHYTRRPTRCQGCTIAFKEICEIVRAIFAAPLISDAGYADRVPCKSSACSSGGNWS
jgi:hypothetical protein